MTRAGLSRWLVDHGAGAGDGLARIPDELSMTDAAPFGCAGVTTFNALRGGGAPTGSRIVVASLAGLGHLAVQFARALGYETVVIGRGDSNEADALELGASTSIDAEQQPVGAAVRALGGVSVVPHGRLVVVGVDGQPFPVPLGMLVSKACTVAGHLTGSSADTEAAMRFAVRSGVRPRTQLVPLGRISEGLAQHQAGWARCRMVVTDA